jgi:hypothetical protein
MSGLISSPLLTSAILPPGVLKLFAGGYRVAAPSPARRPNTDPAISPLPPG